MIGNLSRFFIALNFNLKKSLQPIKQGYRDFFAGGIHGVWTTSQQDKKSLLGANLSGLR
jgi:hypothetical protein